MIKNKLILVDKFENNTASICVIGLGYVGLPLLMECKKHFDRSIGYDIDKSKIESIKNKKSYISDFKDEDFESIKDCATHNIDDIMNYDCYVICVPTPLKDGKIYTKYIESVFVNLANILITRTDCPLISLESTTYPGCTNDMEKILNDSGLKRDINYHVVFSPERIDPGNEVYTINNTPKVVGGDTQLARDAGFAFYSKITSSVYVVNSTKVAESTKLLENTYRLVNISLINELNYLFKKLNIDVWDVIDAAKTKPFGFTPFYPSARVGGHCIPVDPVYLNYAFKQVGLRSDILEDAIDVNEYSPLMNVAQVMNQYNTVQQNTLIVGITYKKDVNDERESAFKEFYNWYNKENKCFYYDPYIKKSQYSDKESLTEEEVKNTKFGKCLILTDHACYSDDLLQCIVKNCENVFDSRNIMAKRGIVSDNIIRI